MLVQVPHRLPENKMPSATNHQFNLHREAQKKKKKFFVKFEVLIKTINADTISHTINDDDLVLVSRWNASEPRVQLQMFTSSQLVIESIELWTVADLALHLIDVSQDTAHDQTTTTTTINTIIIIIIIIISMCLINYSIVASEVQQIFSQSHANSLSNTFHYMSVTASARNITYW